MSEQRSPQEVSYIIHVEGVEEYTSKKAQPKWRKGLLGRIFGRAAPDSGRHAAAATDQGAFDHSTIPAVLAELERLNKRQRECLDDYSARVRLEGYDYARRESVEIWVGPSLKLLAAGTQAKFYPGDAWHFAGEAITAENLGEALTRCGSPETRARSIAQALEPPQNPKLMKPLKLKAGGTP